MKASVSSLARVPEHLDVFFVNGDGRMNSAWYHDGIGWSNPFSIGGFFPAGAAVATVARIPQHLDVFVIGNDGQLYTAWWHEGQNWSGAADNWLCLGGAFPPGAALSAVARFPNHLDVFAVGNDGRVYSAFWHEGQNWSGFFSIGGFFPAGAVLSAVARVPEQLDVFVIGNDGRVWTSWWHDGQASWSGAADNWMGIGGFFPAGGSIHAVARLTNHLDVFVLGNDGRVYTAWWHEGQNWSGGADNWLSIGGFFPANAAIHAVARQPEQLDVFTIGNDGRAYTAWWSSANGWSGINDNWLSLGGFFPVGGPLWAVARHPEQLDLFTLGNDGRLYTSWWSAGQSWSGVNDNWFQIQDTQNIVLRGPIITEGITALGGEVTVTLQRDGNIRFQGHVHDSGFEDYDFTIGVVVHGDYPIVIALQKSGSVEGTESGLPFGTPNRNFDWDEMTFNPSVAQHFEDLKRNIVLEVHQQTDGNITGKLEDIANFAIRWIGGTLLINPLTGLIIFAGVELYSLIDTGSLTGGARVLAGTLWLAGPFGTLYALAAEGIAELGENERQLTGAEYDFAQVVFAGTLPPVENLVLTDTIGGGHRAFTFPRFDGKVTLNMGQDGFRDPLSYNLDRGRLRGEVFIHELTHAWQIQHTHWSVGLLASALASKVCEVTGNPYDYGNDPAKPWADYNLEQQASIVGDWFAGRKTAAMLDTNSPYFHYIAENIRLGNPG